MGNNFDGRPLWLAYIMVKYPQQPTWPLLKHRFFTMFKFALSISEICSVSKNIWGNIAYICTSLQHTLWVPRTKINQRLVRGPKFLNYSCPVQKQVQVPNPLALGMMVKISSILRRQGWYILSPLVYRKKATTTAFSTPSLLSKSDFSYQDISQMSQFTITME